VRLGLKKMGRETSARQAQARALGWNEIKEFIGSAGQGLRADRERALLCAAYEMLARRGELVALEVRDIEFWPNGTGQALIRRGKTDAEGQGRVAYLSRETVKWLKVWLDHANISEGRVFRRLIGRNEIGDGLNPGSIAPIFKRVAQWIGMPARFVAEVSGHSTRVGAAQDLAELDIDLAAIAQAGGWKSPRMPLQYAEKINAARSGMARAAKESGRDSTNPLPIKVTLDTSTKDTSMTEAVDPRDPFTLQAEREFRASVRPIYRNISALDRRPMHIASCLLLNIDGTPVVSTAAHVIDHLRESPLYIGGSLGAGLVPIIGGRIRSTSAPGGDRNSDHFDSAFWEPPPSTVAAMGKVEFLSASRLSRALPAPGKLYTAIGYPVSRNKQAIDHAANSITTRISMYTANVETMPGLATKLGVSGAEHFFLRFEKRAFTGDGASTNTFGARGLSGGALLDLGDFTSPESYSRDPRGSALLSGMVIEYYKGDRALVAVRIGEIVNGIRRALALP
jgi:hypothetical protein